MPSTPLAVLLAAISLYARRVCCDLTGMYVGHLSRVPQGQLAALSTAMGAQSTASSTAMSSMVVASSSMVQVTSQLSTQLSTATSQLTAMAAETYTITVPQGQAAQTVGYLCIFFF